MDERETLCGVVVVVGERKTKHCVSVELMSKGDETIAHFFVCDQ